MTILYSCRHDGDLYRISKFNDGNVESSYLTDGSACDCPAGQRRVCRHREMLPLFIRRGAINSGWQLDYDRGGWVQMYADEVEHTTPAELTIETMIELPNDITATEIAERFAQLQGPANPIAEYMVDRTLAAVQSLPSEASTTPADTLPPLPEGVQMFGMDDMLGIHNAIAEAVGEPEAMIPPPAKPWRRF